MARRQHNLRHVSGADAVIDRAHKLASYGLKFELLHLLVSRDNMALSLHNTAQQGDRFLDEYVAIICRLKNDKITEIETFLSDIDGMNAFFIRDKRFVLKGLMEQ